MVGYKKCACMNMKTARPNDGHAWHKAGKGNKTPKGKRTMAVSSSTLRPSPKVKDIRR